MKKVKNKKPPKKKILISACIISFSSSQISGVAPLMYVNSNAYGSSALITSGVNPLFGHQITGSVTQQQQPAATPSYIGATLMPNVMLQQTVPVVGEKESKLWGEGKRKEEK